MLEKFELDLEKFELDLISYENFQENISVITDFALKIHNELNSDMIFTRKNLPNWYLARLFSTSKIVADACVKDTPILYKIDKDSYDISFYLEIKFSERRTQTLHVKTNISKHIGKRMAIRKCIEKVKPITAKMLKIKAVADAKRTINGKKIELMRELGISDYKNYLINKGRFIQI